MLWLCDVSFFAEDAVDVLSHCSSRQGSVESENCQARLNIWFVGMELEICWEKVA
jgi:hypothetical protein